MRGQVTRLGGKDSGIVAFAQGWRSGVKVFGHATVSDEDEFTISATSGSDQRGVSVQIATISNGRIFLNIDADGKRVDRDERSN